MKKQLKVILIIMMIILIIVTAVLVGYKLLNKPKELSKMSFEFQLDNIENYLYMIKDDFGGWKNTSVDVGEEIFLDDKIGMYDFSITGDGENTLITYTVKNHSDEKVDAFDYELNFFNSTFEQIESLKLNSQKLSKKASYQVEIKIKGNVVGVYKLIPSFSNKAVGKKGEINNEIA